MERRGLESFRTTPNDFNDSETNRYGFIILDEDRENDSDVDYQENYFQEEIGIDYNFTWTSDGCETLSHLSQDTTVTTDAEFEDLTSFYDTDDSTDSATSEEAVCQCMVDATFNLQSNDSNNANNSNSKENKKPKENPDKQKGKKRKHSDDESDTDSPSKRRKHY